LFPFVISGFLHDVDKICAFLPCCYRCSGLTSWSLKVEPIARPETSLRDYYCTLCNVHKSVGLIAAIILFVTAWLWFVSDERAAVTTVMNILRNVDWLSY